MSLKMYSHVQNLNNSIHEREKKRFFYINYINILKFSW
jgi:hypothetical protein